MFQSYRYYFFLRKRVIVKVVVVGIRKLSEGYTTSDVISRFH